ncbi:MAG: class I SAM-dependent methyltransferase [Alphaproteobacteria bacterium]|nr:class I SAM-dependent methyltransferase [Alphaproteobacteria bacterium]
MTSPDAVEQHYSGRGLAERIFATLAAEGHDTGKLTPEILAPYDEFHVGGLAATRRFSGRLSLEPPMRLLDVGCGAGGPARAIAADTGCAVTGIDLTAGFITAGVDLNRRCGLEQHVTLHHGSALDMPFEDGAFDRAMMLHVGMNIDDKPALLAEVARVLVPGGIFGIYDMMQVGEGIVSFPMPWASTADVSAVATPQDYLAAAKAAGFTLAAQHDETAAAEGFFKHVLATKPPTEPGKAPDQFRNLAAHIEAGILAPTELILVKDS